MAASDKDVRSAYTAGLTLLARRELSEAQVQQRLLRKGHTQDAVDAAIARLKAERAIDDTRVAEAIARTELTVRRRGRARVERRIRSAGIARDRAQQAVDQAYAHVDSEALLVAALERKLKGRRIADQREFQRLYRYLVSQGFESDKILSVLRLRSKVPPSDD